MDSSNYVEVKIENISLFKQNFIVLLRPEGGTHVLPICIGPAEAQSIAVAINNQPFPRPLTHDLVRNILNELDCQLVKIHVNDLKDGVFYGRIFLTRGGRELEVDSRPSDAIALAIRYNAPIFVRDDILRENSVDFSGAAEKPEAATPDASGAAEKKPTDPLAQLRQSLAKAVKTEDYEEAARLRDAIEKFGKGN